ASVQGNDAVARLAVWHSRAERQRRAVQNVATHRPAARCRLDTDLMHPPRVRLDLQQRPALDAAQVTVGKPGQARSPRLCGAKARAGLVLDFQEPVLPYALGRHDVTVDQRPVEFADLSIMELFRQARGRLAAACKQDHAAGGAVETMRDAKVNVAGLVVLFLEIGS